MLRPFCLVALVAVIGCGESAPPGASPPEPVVATSESSSVPATASETSAPVEPEATAAEAREPETPPAAREPEAPPAASVHRSPRRPSGPRLSSADRSRVDTALREARGLTRGGQHAEALAQLETALAIDRSNWRVACEAGFVAWRAGDLETAQRHVREAMNAMPPGFVAESRRAPTAMCLFNAGLVAEAAGHADDARAMWEESLRLRDNATVRARLSTLPPAPDPRRPWQRLPASATLEEIVASMAADFAATGLAGFERGELTADEIPLETVPVTGGGESLEASRVSASFGVTSGGEQRIEALVVRGAGALAVALLSQSYDAGESASSTSIDVGARFEDVLPGGAPELIVELDTWGGSSGYTEVWGLSRHVVVCSVDLGSLRCIALPTAELSGEVGGERLDDEPSVELEGSCRALALTDGQAVFTPCLGDEAEARDAPFIDGTHALRELLAREDLRWPDTWTPIEPVGS